MISDYMQRLSQIKEGVRKVSVYRDILRSQISNETSSIEKLKYESELCQKCAEVFKTWLEDSLKQNVDSMSSLVTAGLKHVIHDQNLVFKILQEMKHNRLSMRFVLEEEGAEGDPMSKFGGGAVLIISFILRLAIMARMNMSNLLLLDESMSALANQYVPAAGSFMRQLSEEMGVNILMVTHNHEFLDHAHNSYEGRKDGSLRLIKHKSVR